MSEAASGHLILRPMGVMGQKRDRVIDRVDQVAARISSLEDQVTGHRADMVRLDHRMDGFEKRMARVERRLDLSEV